MRLGNKDQYPEKNGSEGERSKRGVVGRWEKRKGKKIRTKKERIVPMICAKSTSRAVAALVSGH